MSTCTLSTPLAAESPIDGRGSRAGPESSARIRKKAPAWKSGRWPTRRSGVNIERRLIFSRAMGTAPELLFCQQGEEAFKQVEAGGAGRSEVEIPARMPGQPAARCSR